jgi:1,2-phenylacetyl-CoA epoxidase PaaB subunit
MERVYDVLARVKRDIPLQVVGTVTAHTQKLAVVYASKIYDEFQYIDMKIVPRDALTTVYAKSPVLERSHTS